MTIGPVIRRHILLGVTGRAGVGKDTLAQAFLAELELQGRPGTRMALADKLRDVADALFGSRFETREDKDRAFPEWEKVFGPGWGTGRGILQQLGTDVFRKALPDFWAAMLAHRLSAHPPAFPIVITDIRFDNEAALVYRHGGMLVRLRRNGLAALDIPPEHASECGVSDGYVNETFTTTSVEETQILGSMLARRLLLRARAGARAAEDLTPARPAEEAAP